MSEAPIALSVSALLRGSIKRLAHVFRYSSLPVIRRESVAEHTAFVALFSLMIAKDIQKSTRYSVDMDTLLQSALLHDIDESLSGDFLRSVKYGVPGLKDLLDQASDRFIASIESQIGVEFKHDWKLAKNPLTVEGWIVSIADLMGVVSYLEEELALGNRHIAYILEEVYCYFKHLLADETCPQILTPYINDTIGIISVLKDKYLNYEDNATLMPPEGAYDDHR